MTASIEDLRGEAAKLVAAYRQAGAMLATAESCTGGLVAALLTDVPGSSAVLDRGFVTYSNGAKNEMLGVEATALERHGAVSQTVARQMADGALRRSHAHVAVAVTGIAGPGGGSAEKPVGLVHFAAASLRGISHREARFGDLGRDAIRRASVAVAFAMLLEALGGQPAGEAGADRPSP